MYAVHTVGHTIFRSSSSCSSPATSPLVKSGREKVEDRSVRRERGAWSCRERYATKASMLTS